MGLGYKLIFKEDCNEWHAIHPLPTKFIENFIQKIITVLNGF